MSSERLETPDPTRPQASEGKGRAVEVTAGCQRPDGARCTGGATGSGCRMFLSGKWQGPVGDPKPLGHSAGREGGKTLLGP